MYPEDNSVLHEVGLQESRSSSSVQKLLSGLRVKHTPQDKKQTIDSPGFLFF